MNTNHQPVRQNVRYLTPRSLKNIKPFELLFGRKPCISLDTIVPQIDTTDRSRGLDNFVESRRQSFREVRLALERHHQSKIKARLKANNKITRESAGTAAQTGDIVLVKESSSNIEHNGSGGKLKRERRTGPWGMAKSSKRGLDNQSNHGRKKHLNPPCIPWRYQTLSR